MSLTLLLWKEFIQIWILVYSHIKKLISLPSLNWTLGLFVLFVRLLCPYSVWGWVILYIYLISTKGARWLWPVSRACLNSSWTPDPMYISSHLSGVCVALHSILYLLFGLWLRFMRIRDRIDPPHPLVCRKRRLNGAVFRMRPEKPRSRVTAGVAP
jgi:hypothetical protein